MTTVTGSSDAPAASGLYPATCCNSTGRRNNAPPSPQYTASVTTLADVNCRFLNAPSGSIGDAVRRSRTPNATNASTPSPSATAAPAPPSAMNPYVNAARPPVASTAPSRSRRPCGPGSVDSGTCRVVSRTTPAATGRLMKNTSRQDTTVISHPPSRGPSAVATAPSPDHAPIAAARSSGVNDACRMARLPGVSSAPPTPCNARQTTNTPTFGASPQPAEATANQTVPTRNTRRRPYRSPSEPPTSSNAESVSE
jgi:hypothetical protein